VTITLKHPGGVIKIEEIGLNQRSILVEPANRSVFVSKTQCVTSYSTELIESILSVKGPGYLVDEIMRDEDPNYVQKSIRYDVLSYVSEQELDGTRILDFGCGAGASTMILARMLPNAEIVGVELEKRLLDVASLRKKFYRFDQLELLLSPDGTKLPDQIGEFDYIMMSGVFEHLLPHERKILLPKLWGHLKPQGVLFVSQLPHRYFPFEMHTTRLPLTNYLPDKFALYYARQFSKKVKKYESWEDLLRRGIRGGSDKEIRSMLESLLPHKPILLNPRYAGVKDRIDLWYKVTASTRSSTIKNIELFVIRMIKVLFGHIFTPLLSLAIKKL
jgi:2-polyprenyl-3-methyl-5-hydroxy-6-metoxy-1,4-benzoquinol methylase